jgi:hypothetical protein
VLNVLDSNKLRYISNKLFQCFECWMLKLKFNSVFELHCW